MIHKYYVHLPLILRSQGWPLESKRQSYEIPANVPKKICTEVLSSSEVAVAIYHHNAHGARLQTR